MLGYEIYNCENLERDEKRNYSMTIDDKKQKEITCFDINVHICVK